MAGESYNIPQAPRMVGQLGVRTAFGHILPPNGRVAAYVCNGTCQDAGDKQFSDNLVSTLDAGLSRCRTGYGDTVYVLPGHSESGVGTTMLANLKADTKIIGLGSGASLPTFRWTAATDNWALNKANVSISGLRLRMEGANGVTTALTVSAADCTVSNCDIEVASGATAVATNPILITTGATRFNLQGNLIRGVTGSCTDGILMSAAVDGVRICDNEMQFGVAVSVTHANITLSGANTNLFIARNYIANNVASTCAIAVADVASTGIIADNYISVLTNGSAASIGIIFAGAATTTLRCFQNFVSDEPAKSGALSPAAAG